MKNIYFTALFACFAFNNLSAQTNLVSNGGFETVDANGIPVDWNLAPTPTLSVVTEGAYEGTNAIASSSFTSISRNIDGIQAGATYTFSFWYKCVTIDDASPYRSRLRWKKESGASSGGYITSTPICVNDTWILQTEELIAPADAVRLSITIEAQNSSVILDNVSLTTDALSIGDINTKSLNVYTQGNTVFIPTQGGEQIAVYNLIGQQIATGIGQAEETVVANLPQNQMLIVRSDNRTAKVILK